MNQPYDPTEPGALLRSRSGGTGGALLIILFVAVVVGSSLPCQCSVPILTPALAVLIIFCGLSALVILVQKGTGRILLGLALLALALLLSPLWVISQLCS